jgi:hypothetical protein
MSSNGRPYGSNTICPICSNAAGSDPSDSSVVPGRGCSSRSRTTSPSASRTGTMLRPNRPSSTAAAARCWLTSANRSTSSRVNPSSDAMTSAEMPCGTVG